MIDILCVTITQLKEICLIVNCSLLIFIKTAAGGDTNLLGDIDGVDQWTSLQFDSSSERRDILLNMDERTKNAALRASNWKLIVGMMFTFKYNKNPIL